MYSRAFFTIKRKIRIGFRKKCDPLIEIFMASISIIQLAHTPNFSICLIVVKKKLH